MTTSLPAQSIDRSPIAEGAVFSIILALSFSHFLNDTMQSLVPALYPMMKDSYGLSFAQIGLITLAMQVVSSLLQPMVGLFADQADSCRADRDPERPVEHRVVLVGCLACHDRSGDGRQLVPPGAPSGAGPQSCSDRPCWPHAAYDRLVGGDPDGAGVLQSVLHREPRQLLHLLPDPQIRRVGRGGATLLVRLSRRCRCRNLGRRPDRRPGGSEGGHLGLDCRGHSLHPRAALCRPVLD